MSLVYSTEIIQDPVDGIPRVEAPETVFACWGRSPSAINGLGIPGGLTDEFYPIVQELSDWAYSCTLSFRQAAWRDGVSGPDLTSAAFVFRRAIGVVEENGSVEEPLLVNGSVEEPLLVNGSVEEPLLGNGSVEEPLIVNGYH
jgi:hypothetical protein